VYRCDKGCPCVPLKIWMSKKEWQIIGNKSFHLPLRAAEDIKRSLSSFLFLVKICEMFGICDIKWGLLKKESMIHFDENKPYNPINYSNGQWIKFGCGFIIVLIVTILGLIINSFF
jgi:hypothetical protein